MRRVWLLADRIGVGGTGGYALQLSGGLRKLGWCVTLASRLPFPGATVGPLASARERARSEGALVVGLARVKHCDLLRAGGGVHAAYLRTRSRRWARLSREAWWDLQCLRTAGLVVANSNRVQAELAARGVGSVVVRTGVDGERFQPNQAMREYVRERFGVTGRLVMFLAHGYRRKGLSQALSAFRSVAQPGDRMLVLGDDAHAQRWRRALPENVRWVGGVRRPEDWLVASDCLVHPTSYDAAANVVLQALSCGVPVVTTRADGASEVVPEPRWIVDSHTNVEGIATALRLALEGGHRARCVQAARGWPVSRNSKGLDRLLRMLHD